MNHDGVPQDSEAWRWGAVTAARRIGVGEVSSREVVASVLDRVEAVNPSVNAVVDVMAEAALADNVAIEDAPLARNLRRAGAVIVGRTNTPCFSIRWFTDNDLYGRTSNPWDPTVTPGGSSGGAAAALATGMGARCWASPASLYRSESTTDCRPACSSSATGTGRTSCWQPVT